MGGPLAIPPTELRTTLDLFELTKMEERHRCLRHIIGIDNAYLEYAKEQRERKP